jgi:hypothetical protein
MVCMHTEKCDMEHVHMLSLGQALKGIHPLATLSTAAGPELGTRFLAVFTQGTDWLWVLILYSEKIAHSCTPQRGASRARDRFQTSLLLYNS